MSGSSFFLGRHIISNDDLPKANISGIAVKDKICASCDYELTRLDQNRVGADVACG